MSRRELELLKSIATQLILKKFQVGKKYMMIDRDPVFFKLCCRVLKTEGDHQV